MALLRIDRIALPVSDADAAEDFYGNKLGLKKVLRYGEVVFFDCAGIWLMLEGTVKASRPSTGICHYFRVDDIEATAATLKARGVQFDTDPHIISRAADHALWMAFFRDPDGHLLALMEERR